MDSSKDDVATSLLIEIQERCNFFRLSFFFRAKMLKIKLCAVEIDEIKVHMLQEGHKNWTKSPISMEFETFQNLIFLKLLVHL